MHELAALIKKGAVVFVGFHHKEGRFTQTRGNAKVLRYATNQKTGAHARVFQNPRHHAGGRGFAVRACHRQHPAALQHMVSQPLRAGNIRQPLIQYIFYGGITA